MFFFLLFQCVKSSCFTLLEESLDPCIYKNWCPLEGTLSPLPWGAGSNVSCTPLSPSFPQQAVLLALPGGQGTLPRPAKTGYHKGLLSVYNSVETGCHQFPGGASQAEQTEFQEQLWHQIAQSDPLNLHLEMFGNKLPRGMMCTQIYQFVGLSEGENCCHLVVTFS